MLKPTRPWSYSALNAFETCPRRYQLTRVTKEAHERQHEASIWGNKVHKHLEDYANGKNQLPKDLQKYAKYVDKIFTYEGWKTGKRKPNSDQLMLFAALAFAYYPWIEKVVCGFIWLKDSSFDKEIYTREQIQEIWSEFLPRVDRLEIAFNEDKWQAKPSGLCRNWCPVGKKLCEFCGE